MSSEQQQGHPFGVTVLSVMVTICAVAACTGVPAADTAERPPPPAPHESVHVGVAAPGAPISPLVRGMSGAPEHYVRALGLRFNSWGGNPSSRYNFKIGNAWNAGADWQYRNGDYDTKGDAAHRFLSQSSRAGAETRLAVPTIGWVARNADNDTCSFPGEDRSCRMPEADCTDPGPLADPRTANVQVDETDVARWIADLVRADNRIAFIAMDNEPELWGVTHYDVHPECTTYEEVRDTYIRYAAAIAEVAPNAALTGPVMCCWYDFWGTAPGTSGAEEVDYLTWFLEELREHEERTGDTLLDVVDVHYYPQSGVYNDETDAETAARRLRSTRALFDTGYVDESWIGEPIALIPRLQKAIEEHYPGRSLMISEWNFGGDESMSGALAIADTLGIFGREGVAAAAYWRFPPEGSPGWFAFKLHGNYDERGSAFEGAVATTTNPDHDRLSTYASVDADGDLMRLMLINKQPDAPLATRVRHPNFPAAPTASSYRYSPEQPRRIVTERVPAGRSWIDITLPAYSITVVELHRQEE